MGLSGGKTGAKAVFLEQFAGAFRNLKALKDVRQLVGVERSQTLAVLDGNVMMNAIPASVDTFRGYVSILSHQIEEACTAAAHVVVVFDEPDAMTTAKRDEQRRRDEQRQARVPFCSEDLVATIMDDNFSTNDLHTNGCNAKLLMEFRAARPRFYDAVCVALLMRFRANMIGGAWSLTFDGIDWRGADRGFGIPRHAGILSSDEDFWAALLSRPTGAIGEGDLKLTDVTQRVHDASRIEGTPVHGVLLNLVVTIDTDSFVIELLQENRRRAARGGGRPRRADRAVPQRARAQARGRRPRDRRALHVLRHAALPRSSCSSYFLRHQEPRRHDAARSSPRRSRCWRWRSPCAAATLWSSRACAPTRRCRWCAASCASTRSGSEPLASGSTALAAGPATAAAMRRARSSCSWTRYARVARGRAAHAAGARERHAGAGATRRCCARSGRARTGTSTSSRSARGGGLGQRVDKPLRSGLEVGTCSCVCVRGEVW